MRKLLLIVIDPNALTRALLKYIFNSSPGVEIISEAADHESAITALGNVIPDALIIGSELPKTERKSLLSAIGSHYPGVRVIELSEVENHFLRSPDSGTGKEVRVCCEQPGACIEIQIELTDRIRNSDFWLESPSVGAEVNQLTWIVLSRGRLHREARKKNQGAVAGFGELTRRLGWWSPLVLGCRPLRPRNLCNCAPEPVLK
jgi:hypothetical protein